MDAAAVAAELDKPLASQLLHEAALLRLAYVALDGTARVVPVGFLWRDRRIIVCTSAHAGKVKALRHNPLVATTIDHDGTPPRALIIRGRAGIEMVDGVPQDFLDASLKTESARGAADFAAGARAMYDTMARISIEPTFARMNDFETTLPKDVERIAISKGFMK